MPSQSFFLLSSSVDSIESSPMLIAVIPQDPFDSPRLAGPDDVEGALLIHGRRCGGAAAAVRAQAAASR